jgi:hypothetical protein
MGDLFVLHLQEKENKGLKGDLLVLHLEEKENEGLQGDSSYIGVFCISVYFPNLFLHTSISNKVIVILNSFINEETETASYIVRQIDLLDNSRLQCNQIRDFHNSSPN